MRAAACDRRLRDVAAVRGLRLSRGRKIESAADDDAYDRSTAIRKRNHAVQDLAKYLAESVSRELIARTKYTVVADPKDADAVLYGSIANVFANATTIDPNTGRATGAQITIQVQVRLVDKIRQGAFHPAESGISRTL